jgi:glycosyltransferase involved in cell wall biosynthesis
MRITWIHPEPQMTGGSRVVAIHAQGLMARGHRVVIVTTPRRPPSPRAKLRALVRERRWLRKPRRGPSHFDNTAIDHRVVESGRITDRDVPDGDVVIATWWETAAPVAALPPSKGAKAYWVSDYGAPGMELQDIVPTWRLPMRLITIAPWLAALVREHIGDVPVDLVPNSVDPREFHAPPRGRCQVPTVGFNYREAWIKGPDLALEAFRIARQRLPDLRLRTYGPVAPRQLRSLPEGMSFELLPANDELRDIYAGCDAWLFTSRREGFGLQILEAMACRTPVIATPAGAAPELIAARGGGVLVKHEDPEDIARAIERFCSLDDAEWRRYSTAALETTQGYTWDDATDRLEAALRAVVEPTRRAASSDQR